MGFYFVRGRESFVPARGTPSLEDLYYTMLYYTILYYTILCYTTLCYAMLCYAML